MLVYPILNFVLPLMLSSFVLVDNLPQCSESKVKKEEITFKDDEFPRHGTTIEKISSLKPVC